MTDDGKIVDLKLLDVDGNLSDRLSRVGVNEDREEAGRPSDSVQVGHDPGYLGDRLKKSNRNDL